MGACSVRICKIRPIFLSIWEPDCPSVRFWPIIRRPWASDFQIEKWQVFNLNSRCYLRQQSSSKTIDELDGDFHSFEQAKAKTSIPSKKRDPRRHHSHEHRVDQCRQPSEDSEQMLHEQSAPGASHCGFRRRSQTVIHGAVPIALTAAVANIFVCCRSDTAVWIVPVICWAQIQRSRIPMPLQQQSIVD